MRGGRILKMTDSVSHLAVARPNSGQQGFYVTSHIGVSFPTLQCHSWVHPTVHSASASTSARSARLQSVPSGFRRQACCILGMDPLSDVQFLCLKVTSSHFSLFAHATSYVYI